MKKLLLTGIAVLFLATGTAHARNVRDYQCGKTQITAAITKDTGTPVAYQITITRPLADLPKNRHPITSGTFVFKEIDDPVGYFVNGKRYKCKEIPE